MKRAALTYWLGMLVLCTVFYVSLKAWQRLEAGSSSQPDARAVAAADERAHRAPSVADLDKTVERFELIDQNGEKFDSATLEGKVWVASFFFTNCPGVCWRLNQAVSNLQAETSKDVQFVSITCDPKNDTPQALATYAKHFKAEPARWHFLTGDFKDIQNVGQKSFMVAVDVAVHSERAMVVDKAGKIQGSFNMLDAEQVKKLKTKVEELN